MISDYSAERKTELLTWLIEYYIEKDSVSNCDVYFKDKLKDVLTEIKCENSLQIKNAMQQIDAAKYSNYPNYSDVIKALALGADYVMVGGLFASMYESASPLVLGIYNNTGYMTYEECDYQYTSEEKKRKDIKNRNLYKECYGMSTKKAQELIDPTHKKKTAEGKHSMMKVQHTLQQWTENMIDYLKSAMSYCGAKRLNDFIGQPDIIINSPGTMLSVNK